jgi:hypothetical protein
LEHSLKAIFASFCGTFVRRCWGPRMPSSKRKRMREKQLSTFFTVQLGRPTPGPAKCRQLSPKPSRHPKLTAVYPHEWEQRKDFYKNTYSSLEQHIARHKCEITIATRARMRVCDIIGKKDVTSVVHYFVERSD